MAQLVGCREYEVLRTVEPVDPYLPGDRSDRPVLYMYRFPVRAGLEVPLRKRS